MNAIKTLLAALANLAGAINNLAALLDVATGRLRHTLALDEAGMLEHEPVGEVEGETPAPRRASKRAASA